MTDRYAVIGNPISQSKSPLIHGLFANATGQDIDYGLVESPLDDFEAKVQAFRSAGGRGMNVTAPFKLKAFALADERNENARIAGAANTLRFDADKIIAENFDGIGLVTDIVTNLGFALAGKRVLLLGAGGAARGALLPFLEQEPSLLTLVNRTEHKAYSLAFEFRSRGRIVAAGYGSIPDIHYDIVVNATSASLVRELPPITNVVFGPGCLAYDLAYGKGLTPFLRLAKGSGAGHIADGVGMLVQQAAEAFFWWRGVRPGTSDVIAQLAVPLADQAD